MGELTDKIKGNVNEALGKAKQQSNNPAPATKARCKKARARCSSSPAR